MPGTMLTAQHARAQVAHCTLCGHPHLADEENEAPRGQVACLKSHSSEETAPAGRLRLSGLHSLVPQAPSPKGATGRAYMNDCTRSQKGPRWKLLSGSAGMSPDNNGPRGMGRVGGGGCGRNVRGQREEVVDGHSPLAAIILSLEGGEQKGPIRHLSEPGGV